MASPIRTTGELTPGDRENKELIDFHREMIRIHKKYPVLSHGSLKFLYGEHNVIAYGRFDMKERVIVAFHNGQGDKTFMLPVWQVGVCSGHSLKRVMLTGDWGYTTEPQEYQAEGGELTLTLPTTSAIVLVEMVPEEEKEEKTEQ